jgi:hypothetical protein
MVLFGMLIFGKIENEEVGFVMYAVPGVCRVSVCNIEVESARVSFSIVFLEETRMRKCVGILMVCAILLSIGSTAQATRTWTSGGNGNWSDTTKWSGSTLPSSSETAQISNGTVALDASQTIGQLLMGYASTDVTTLNITSGQNLTVAKSSAELFCLVKAGTSAGASTTVNQSAGTVRVATSTANVNGGTGETRLVTASTTLGTAIYNLSGTAVLDTEVLSKGNKTNTAAQFNATGGTLVLRTMMYRFGLISEGAGFNQGGAKLELGAIGTVAAIGFGNTTNSMDYTVGSTGTINFDIASISSFDKITQYGSIASIDSAALQIDLLGGYTPTVGSTFDVWTVMSTTGVANGAGSGTGTLPAGWSSAWVDTNADLTLDTLRLTYTPEPATIALLGLGLLAIRRNKK